MGESRPRLSPSSTLLRLLCILHKDNRSLHLQLRHWRSTGTHLGGTRGDRARLRSRRGHRSEKLQLGLQGHSLLVNHLELLLELAVETRQHGVGFPVFTDRHLDLPLLSGQQLLSRFSGRRKRHGGRGYSLQVLALGMVFPADWLLWCLTMGHSSDHILF